MADMGGFELLKKDQDHPKKTRLNTFNLESELKGYEVDFSIITEDLIMDKSKGDSIAKALVVLQTSWFAIQCAVRVGQGLPVTELEITTLAHTPLICFIYFFGWNKLLIVIPLTLHAKRVDGMDLEVDDEDSSRLESHTTSSLMTTASESTATPRPTLNNCQLSWRIRLGDYISKADDIYKIRKNNVIRDLSMNTFTLLITGTFGAIHCLAWNLHFPSRVEQILWRVSALTVTVYPWFLTYLLSSLSKLELPYIDTTVGLGVAVGLYTCARLCLLTIAFLSLRNLPFAAYQTPSWTNFIPHL